MSDLISRQAAWDALNARCEIECDYSRNQRAFMCGACKLGSAFEVIEELPTIERERDIKHTESISLISTDAEPKREIEEIKAQAYAEGFRTALGAILDMLKGATKYENCKLYNEGFKDGERSEDE